MNVEKLFLNNQAWVEKVQQEDPDFFKRLEAQQSPKFLWVGCSDSRVPANQITGLMPGEIFVHRNIANMVIHTDLNALSVIQFAVDVLKVEHIIICGHYGCAGVKAGLQTARFGLVDMWLQHVKAVSEKHATYLQTIPDEFKHQRLCELNVIEQVKNIAQTHILQDAWQRRQDVHVHGFIYGVHDGLLRDLAYHISTSDDIHPHYQSSLARIHAIHTPHTAQTAYL